MLTSTYLLLDTETTGLDPNIAEIIQIYISVLDQDFNFYEDIELLVHPDPEKLTSSSLRSFEINGYDPDLWSSRGALSQEELRKRLNNFFCPYKNLIPIGHCVHFDLSFLKRYISKDYNLIIDEIRAIDTCSVAKLFDALKSKKSENYKLTSLCEQYNISFMGSAHNAKMDALASRELLLYFKKEI